MRGAACDEHDDRDDDEKQDRVDASVNSCGVGRVREARSVNYFHFWENRRGLERARQTPQEARLRNSSRFDAIGTDEGTFGGWGRGVRTGRLLGA